MKRKSASSCCSSSSSSSCIAPAAKGVDSILDNNAAETKGKSVQLQTTKKPKRVRAKKAVRDNNSPTTSPKSRSSVYRGVTRHRWTGRYEAHLWDKTTWNSIQNKRGRQIYLGAYDNEEDAARTYDLAALKYWGPTTILNFPVESHTKEMEEMEKMSNEEYLATLRRRSSGFSRGVSKYRGVARHHHNGRWEARIGRVSGNKYLYLGTYGTQEEAAAAYDMAAIEYRGTNAVTNFDISHYADKLKKVLPEWQQSECKHIVLAEEETSPTDEPQAVFDELPNQVVAEEVQPCISMMDPAAAVVMDPTEEHEHPWDLYLDNGFNSLQLPDIPLEDSAEALSWLDGKQFEDDIFGCIFDGPLFGYDELFLGDTDDNVVGELKGGQDLPTSPSSSSLTTMASACSNN